MADKRLSELIRQGVDAWNEWRADNPTESIDLRGEGLTGLKLSGVNLSKASLSHAELSNVDFSGANFHGANLDGAILKAADLHGAKFSEASLVGAELKEANLIDANLSAADLKKADLSRAVLSNAVLSDAILEEATLNGAIFSGAMLNGVLLRVAKLRQADLSSASLHQANISHADLHSANLNGADLSHSDLNRASLNDAQLCAADLSGANLCGTLFIKAHLTMANFSGATLDSATRFQGSHTEGCTIDRYQLERLEDYGGLTVGNRMSMDIKDGVAQLRASYSGFWQWVHLTALAVFIFPYVWFVLVQWSRASFFPSETQAHIPLWEALLTFIYNGGVNWQDGLSFHWSFLAFVFLTFYNFVRLVLLWKTKQLELYQESSGLPAMFSLEGSGWGTLLKVATWSFTLYLAIALFNTGHFFTQEVPLGHVERSTETTKNGG